MRRWGVAPLLLLAACAPKPPPPAPPLGHGTVVQLESAGVAAAEKAAVLRALQGAEVRPCFEALLARTPEAYGEVVVRFTVGTGGGVTDAAAQFSTLADSEADGCVAAAVRATPFPNRDTPITVVYPFLLLTERTPPEVARALRDRYGLLPEHEKDPSGDPRTPIPPGIVVVW